MDIRVLYLFGNGEWDEIVLAQEIELENGLVQTLYLNEQNELSAGEVTLPW